MFEVPVGRSPRTEQVAEASRGRALWLRPSLEHEDGHPPPYSYFLPIVCCNRLFHSSRSTAGMVVISMCPSEALRTAAFMAVLLSGNSQMAITSYSPRQ